MSVRKTRIKNITNVGFDLYQLTYNLEVSRPFVLVEVLEHNTTLVSSFVSVNQVSKLEQNGILLGQECDVCSVLVFYERQQPTKQN